MSFEYSQEVIDDLENLLETDEGYDVIIYAGENENVKEIHALSNILRIKSQYFRTAFSNEFAKKDGKFILITPNIPPQLFKIILRFIYCGKIDLTKLQGPDVLKLLVVVDELKIQTLILCIQEYLVKYIHIFLQQYPIEILETIHQHEIFTDLWNYCLEEICAEPDILFKSDKFINLKVTLLELLLKRDDLLLDEIDIWDNLIRWCFSQHPCIQQDDVNKWNNEEIIIMKRTLHEFIPLIRFYHITSEDFLLKVYPFRMLLPEDLINNVLAFHMAPNKILKSDMQPFRKQKSVSDSAIIDDEHFAIFSSWIEKENDSYYNKRNIPYNFKLLYNSSRDGNSAADFHKRCDNKGATIVIAKVANSDEIIGGYNPVSWDSTNTWKSTKNSFIFSFMSSTNLQTAKVSHINVGYFDYSIYCYQNHGPTFGSGHDLAHYGGTTWRSNNKYSYPKIDIPKNCKIAKSYKFFNIENYEVFQVIKK
ncbi:hypothetical protein RclHR1_14160005 [Rhizophagus clarus]|uniref:BTB/POZ domain-containing protein n=1 Tax=Rhizophagus clarus TaxID=94130 RepID=A0A2Z6QP89_9GLOM|nr:hypothetical protein RclHR1_14160005 [Rhizophagus clarus]GES84990.1 BTB/POZ domain-containing protein [Rhizophagus clarus]